MARLRTLVLVGTAAGLAYVAVKAVRPQAPPASPVPAPAGEPKAAEAAWAAAPVVPEAVPVTAEAPDGEAVDPSEPTPITDPPVDDIVAPDADTDAAPTPPPPVTPPRATRPRGQRLVAAWVDPEGRTCPSTHPVKAKLSSRIFHVVGGLNYDRTAPERCYRDAATAEADGFRQSKR